MVSRSQINYDYSFYISRFVFIIRPFLHIVMHYSDFLNNMSDIILFFQRVYNCGIKKFIFIDPSMANKNQMNCNYSLYMSARRFFFLSK